MFTFIIFFLHFGFIYLQIYDNSLNYLMCGSGYYSTPNLVEYQKKIPKEDNYSPIRIFIDYTSFELDCTQFPDIAKSKDLIKQKLSKAKSLMEQLINVQRFTEKIYLSDDLKTNISLSVPYINQILTTGIWYDLVVFPRVTAFKKISQYTEYKIFNFMSYPLIIEPTLKKPIFGVIDIFNIDYSSMDNLETYFLNSFIHQLIHIMVFDPKLIDKFPNYSNENKPYRRGYDYTGINIQYYIITPKVNNFTKRHFHNERMNGLQMELMNHWSQRYMTGDIMISDFYEEQAISEMTLGLFEDSNWYTVNYYTGGLFRFGKNETIFFTDLKCINDFKFIESMFCKVENERRCTGGRLNKGFCKFYENEAIPTIYQYFSDNPNKGGKGNIEYCPITQKEDDTQSQVFNFYPGSCKEGLLYRNGLEEQFTDHSFCAISTVIPNNNDYFIYNNYRRAVCYPMHCTNTTLTIQIGTFYLTCPKQGGVLTMPSISGYIGAIECPDYNLICTGSVTCNNIEDCIEKKSLAKESTFVYDGFTYAYQKLDNLGYYNIKSTGEGSNNGKCGKNCLFCNEENSCLKCREGEYYMGSKINIKNLTTHLFCDLSEEFTDDKYEYYNNIYYSLNDIIYYNSNQDNTKDFNFDNNNNNNLFDQKNDIPNYSIYLSISIINIIFVIILINY